MPIFYVKKLLLFLIVYFVLLSYEQNVFIFKFFLIMDFLPCHSSFMFRITFSCFNTQH